MKDVKALTRQIEAAKERQEQLEADKNTALKTIKRETRYDSMIQNLGVQRRSILAAALVSKKHPDTEQIDRNIASLEAQQSAARAEAATANDALPIFEEGLELARSTVAELEQKRQAAVTAHIMSTHDAALARYLVCVNDMHASVGELVGAELAWEAMRRPGYGGKFPGRGKQILEDIRTGGIRVPWDHSRLVDPAIAATFTDDYASFWFMPGWADPETLGLGDPAAAQLIRDAREAGMPCVGHAPVNVAPSKMVMVRIIRGSISGQKQGKRNPVTGAMAPGKSRFATVNDDIELEETEARRLADLGMVVIHDSDWRLPEQQHDAHRSQRNELGEHI